MNIGTRMIHRLGLVAACAAVLMCVGCAGKLKGPVLMDAQNPNGVSGMYATSMPGEKVLDAEEGRLLAVSNDGRYIAVRDDDDIAKIIDVESGWSISLGSGHGNLAFSPDGSRVVACGYYTVMIYETESGKLVREIKTDENFSKAEFSPTGDKALLAGTTATEIIDVETGAKLYGFPVGGVYFKAQFSPDGNRLVMVFPSPGLYTDATLRVYDLTNGRIVNEYTAVDKRISDVAISPDGELIALDTNSSGLGHTTTVEVLSASTCRKVFSWEGVDYVFDMGFSADNKRLFTTSLIDGDVQVYDMSNGQVSHSFETKASVYDADISPDSRYLAVGVGQGGLFSKSGATVVYDLESRRVILSKVGRSMVKNVAFLPNGKALIAAGEDGVQYIPLDGLK